MTPAVKIAMNSIMSGVTMHYQTIVTPNGERLVILPEAEFLAMRNALVRSEGSHTVREFQRRFAAGEEELVPSDTVNRLLNGENKVRVWREYRKISARELAMKAGLSAPYISEIESGKKDGSVAAMKKIAEILAVNIDDLV